MRVRLLSILVVSLIVIIGLAFLITFGLFASDVKLEHSEPAAEVEQVDFEAEVLGVNCDPEIDKDGDNVPDNLDVEGSIDWSNCMLVGANLSNLELSYANLSGSVLYGANLYNTNLSGANLSGSVLYGANLYNTNLSGANLAGADLIGKNLMLLDPLSSSNSLELMSKSGFTDMSIPGQLILSHTFGTEGDGIMQLKKPAGIAVDGDGKIYVADFRNNRIQIFNFDGSFDSFINLDGRVHGIEIADDKIYVVKWFGGNQLLNLDDFQKSHIEILHKDGTKISEIPGPSRPVDIAIDGFGKIYATDYLTGTIQIFNTSGSLLKTLTVPSVLDKTETTNPQCTAEIICSKNAKLTGITLDPSGNIYVTDFLNHRVIKLDSSGNILFEFKVPPEEGGNFSRPTNIEINDLTGDVFVTDNSDRVLVFNSSGNFLYTFGESGHNVGQFSGPHGITIDDFGYIYVAEYLNHRIQIFYPVDSFQISPNIAEQESSKDLTGTILAGANLTDVNLSGQDLSYMDFSRTNLVGADMTGTILDKTKFNNANLKGVNLQNANLKLAEFIDVDFTKIKNKSLAGSDLTSASFAHSNLSGVNLSDTIMDDTNFWKANLSDQDFTVIANASIEGSTFIESNLSNSNFEGVNLSPKYEYSTTFENKAYLIQQSELLDEITIIEDLFGEHTRVLITSKEVQGNDLVVNYIYFNSFAKANLENANFKNTKLWNANFYLANLTNADLSGADLRKAFFGEADLSNANLKCINHPICESN
uniref:Tripartite motif-containing protein 71 (TRIM71) n=1 Tax=uncultured marine thaumarchaeote KM3_198_G09 TaxID=1456089 RepID=A0A075GSX7_9ARCH|nr:tripartite motif-containing protein 71 (TRIM71) [uncultured marine thaumarchaeote KM3_198_G09]